MKVAPTPLPQLQVLEHQLARRLELALPDLRVQVQVHLAARHAGFRRLQQVGLQRDQVHVAQRQLQVRLARGDLQPAGQLQAAVAAAPLHATLGFQPAAAGEPGHFQFIQRRVQRFQLQPRRTPLEAGIVEIDLRLLQFHPVDVQAETSAALALLLPAAAQQRRQQAELALARALHRQIPLLHRDPADAVLVGEQRAQLRLHRQALRAQRVRVRPALGSRQPQVFHHHAAQSQADAAEGRLGPQRRQHLALQTPGCALPGQQQHRQHDAERDQHPTQAAPWSGRFVGRARGLGHSVRYTSAPASRNSADFSAMPLSSTAASSAPTLAA